MRITELSVTRLFGIFDHTIKLNDKDRVTIIYGPNGFGKTMLLRMIAAAAEGDSSLFENTPFREFRITLSSGDRAIIRRSPQGGVEHGSHRKLEYLLEGRSGTKQLDLGKGPSGVSSNVLRQLDRHVPPPFHLRGDEWADEDGNVFSLDEIMRKFPALRVKFPKLHGGHPLAKVLGALGVAFIEASRLQARSEPDREVERQQILDFEHGELIWSEPLTHSRAKHSLRVEQYSRDISERIATVVREYAKISQESDSTFPMRLVEFLRKRPKLEASVVSQRIVDLNSRRRRLIDLGLLDAQEGMQGLDEGDVSQALEALSLYLDDTERKLSTFDDISNRIGWLVDTVNKHFSYKKLSVVPQAGFKVVSESGTEIDLKNLSSGEQHELVVLYDLLFNARKGGLFLIDEPEISLHLAWQGNFLEDLIGALDLTDGRAIVATHSPAIIGNRRDLAIDLGAGANHH